MSCGMSQNLNIKSLPIFADFFVEIGMLPVWSNFSTYHKVLKIVERVEHSF